MLCNVVRDADKIDIFYLCGIDKRLILDDNTSVTYKVEQDFISCKSINVEYVRTKADFVLLKLAMIFDLNFKCSYSYIKENKLIEKFYEQIENKQQFYRCFEIVKKYIDNKIETNS